MSAEIFTRRDLERIQNDTFVRHVEFHRELASTNDLAIELAARGDIELPLLVLAEQQTAGRGRGANRWWSAAGALTFSLIVPSEMQTRKFDGVPPISLSVGLAVCEALSRFLPDAQMGLKWPNDVLLQGRKVCGILVEASARQPDRSIIGVGLNVNNSLVSAPSEIRAIADSMHDASGRHFEMAAVLIALLGRIADRWQMLSRDDSPLAADWQKYCALSGRAIELDVGTRRVSGLCRGIDRRGALQVETDRGIERFLSGVIARWSG